MDAGLLPVKKLSDANQRLADEFSQEQREEISRALLSDAMDLCERTSFLRWSIVTGDADAAADARQRGLTVVDDPGAGLNEALAAGIQEAKSAGAGSITIIPVDVPLATAEDVHDLFDTGATSDVVLAPSHSDGGTNALYLSPPDAVQPRFGPASLRAHLDEGHAAGLRCSILDLFRLAIDIDTPEDARAVAKEGGNSRTARLLQRLLEARR